VRRKTAARRLTALQVCLATAAVLICFMSPTAMATTAATSSARGHQAGSPAKLSASVGLCLAGSYSWTNAYTTNSGLYMCVGSRISGDWPAGQVLNSRTGTVSIQIRLQQWAYPNGPFMGSWTSPAMNVPWGFYATVYSTSIGQKAYLCSTVYTTGIGGGAKGTVCG
jgi:hypothetical protein